MELPPSCNNKREVILRLAEMDRYVQASAEWNDSAKMRLHDILNDLQKTRTDIVSDHYVEKSVAMGYLARFDEIVLETADLMRYLDDSRDWNGSARERFLHLISKIEAIKVELVGQH